MIYKIEYDEINPSSAYGSHYFGHEMIFLINKKENLRHFLFYNKMAMLGLWMDDSLVARIVDIMINESLVKETLLINDGDEIHIESFKHRGSSFNKEGQLIATADVVRVLNVVDTDKK